MHLIKWSQYKMWGGTVKCERAVCISNRLFKLFLVSQHIVSRADPMQRNNRIIFLSLDFSMHFHLSVSASKTRPPKIFLFSFLSHSAITTPKNVTTFLHELKFLMLFCFRYHLSENGKPFYNSLIISTTRKWIRRKAIKFSSDEPNAARAGHKSGGLSHSVFPAPAIQSVEAPFSHQG